MTWGIDGSTPAGVNANAQTIQTAAFSPPAGAVLAALIPSLCSGSGMSYTITDTSSGALTWTARTTVPSTAGSAFAAVFTATVPGGGLSGLQVTATESGTNFSNGIALQVLVVTGVVETGGNSFTLSGGTFSGPVQESFTPNDTGSLPVFAMLAWGETTTFTAASNNTFQYNVVPTFSGFGTATAAGYYSGTVTSGVAVTVGSSAPNISSNFSCGVAIYELPLAPAGGVSGTVQPRATVPVPRRTRARAAWRGSAPFTGFVAVAAPRQQPAPAPRRYPARAYVRFTPVTTTNAAPVAGISGPVPVQMVNRTEVISRVTGRVIRR